MSGYTPQSLPSRLVAATKVRGVRPVAGDFLRWGGRVAAGLPRTRTGGRGAFSFDGASYPYLYGAYKRSWMTERAVEVPIVQRIVDTHVGGRVLEVGNVLSHYGPQRHVIVDKYEQAPGVENLDVFDMAGLGTFDLVVAVSTIEHVGWDEDPRVPGKAVEALRALYERVAPGGRLVITIPAGYNPSLDEAVRDGAVEFTSLAAMRRDGGGTSWRQAPPDEALRAPYDFLLYSARGVLIASLERPSASTPPRA
jgi:SAM-dependent methyltransferase